ncbi:MAG TPA: SDR family NAD(P)-dependent oxidoreductase [Chitinophagaceae bacterium]|nr:SDR family NAD(P)-dependent oxidoreductase [Chitinophagaceae bacterium]
MPVSPAEPGHRPRQILITGATGNLGQAVARRFAGAGWHVWGTRHGGNPANTTTGMEGVTWGDVDLQDEAKTGEWIQEIVTAAGSLDAAVLTAGGFAAGSLANTSSSDIQRQYRLNFETAFHAARPVFLHMQERRYGRIFLIGSRAGLHPAGARGTMAYSLSKSLLFHLAEILNAEARGTNVVVSVVVPSTIDTPQNRQSMPDADFTRWIQPGAIADVLYFYCSPEADGIREPILKLYQDA